MRIKFYFVSFLVVIFFSACGTKKKAVSNKSVKQNNTAYHSRQEIEESIAREKAKRGAENRTEESNYKKPEVKKPVFKDNNELYIYNYAQIAKDEMALYGIPASITLAQGILESSAGLGELTRKSNNHFGIKCNGWEGEKAYHDDDAYQECFRKYKDPKYSFRDHSLFLKDRRRYASLFNLKKDDYKGWARGLKRAGYATDPRYPAKLISIIERYQLYRFDEEVLGTGNRDGLPTKTLKVDHTGIRYTVKKGDTLYSIAKRHNLTVEELKQLNNLRNDHLQIGQKLFVKTL